MSWGADSKVHPDRNAPKRARRDERSPRWWLEPEESLADSVWEVARCIDVNLRVRRI